jgi:N-acetyl-1-D-myo-inositol-2-amino-2-deoxy-alpha-D-glucopyranoside deacetylase
VTDPQTAGRLLLVHAHPDDESIGTGATMAHYVAAGHQVTLVTCTLGEEGEILLSDLAHLAADREDGLGTHRQGELGAAMAELGVTDWRLLGGPGRFRDSGMIGTPSNERADCFWRADLLTAAAELVAVIREVRPHVVVTYDDFGGYGHPDHIQAHRVTTYAVALAAAPSYRADLGPAWDVPKMYWTAFPRSVIVAGIEALKAQGDAGEFASMNPDDLPFVVDDALVTTAVDASDFLDHKMAALRAHATQVNVDGGFFALSNNLGSKAFGVEYFRLVRGHAAGPRDADGRETDLLAGVIGG